MILMIFVGYSLLFCGLIAVVCKDSWRQYYIQAKAVMSTAFVLLLFWALYVSGEVSQFWLMLPAFFCCFVGDILMASYNRYRKRVYFLLGAGIFLCGHLCFVRWLCKQQPMHMAELLLPVAAVVFAWKLTSLKKVHTGRLRPFILLYSFFVSLFLVKGLNLAFVLHSISGIMIAAGCVLFWFSDLAIVFLYFCKKKGHGVHIFNLAAYYYAMFLLALNVLFV